MALDGKLYTFYLVSKSCKGGLVPILLTRRLRWDDLPKVKKPQTSRFWTRDQVRPTLNMQLPFPLYLPPSPVGWEGFPLFNPLVTFTGGSNSARQCNSLRVTGRKMNVFPCRMPGPPTQNQVLHHHHEHPERTPSAAIPLHHMWVTWTGSKPSPSAADGIKKEEGTVLVLTSSRSPEGSGWAGGPPKGCGDQRREHNPHGGEAWAEPWRGHPSFLSTPGGDGAHVKARRWETSMWNCQERLSVTKQALRCTVQERCFLI